MAPPPKERVILTSIIVLLFIAIVAIIYKYETDILQRQSHVIGGVRLKQYTAQEVVALIKKLPTYQLDSITVFEDGKIISSIPQLNGGISNIFDNDPNTLEMLKQTARSENLPIGYVVYRHVVPYFIHEHGDRRKKLPDIDSTQRK